MNNLFSKDSNKSLELNLSLKVNFINYNFQMISLNIREKNEKSDKLNTKYISKLDE
jgi:hypothetical protein